MNKRYVYILLSDDCEILATETSLKKLINKHGETYSLLSWGYLTKLLSPKKETGEQVIFQGRDGNTYRLAASRIQ
jgi:hypothetical protein